MKNEFVYNNAEAPAPIRIEQVISEKPGGGLLKDAGYNVPETTPVGLDTDGKYKVIKCAKVKTQYAGSGTSLVVEPGSGIAKNDFIAFGGMAVQVSAVAAAAGEDTLTIGALTGKTINIGDFVYQAAKAATGVGEDNMAEPIVKPLYIVSDGHPTAKNGIVAFAGNGDTPVRLINIANVRKETCCFGAEIEAMLPGINRV